MSSLGGFESFIIGLANRRKVASHELVEHLSNENNMKLECLKILKAKGEPTDIKKIESCFHKLDYANREYIEIFKSIIH
jgi:hypothetical protein